MNINFRKLKKNNFGAVPKGVRYSSSLNDETVVLLGWKGVDEYAYIDYRPEHALKERGRATYKEIKEYVEEKYGLRVTSLNIAQVKDKCGIKEQKFRRKKPQTGAEF